MPPERVDAIVSRLMGDELWSGWGFPGQCRRAMPPTTRSGYHNGTVWPRHLARRLGVEPGRPQRGRGADRPHAARASRFFDWSLPEVFAGFARGSTTRFRSPTRPLRGRRRGPAARRCCCCGSCSGAPDRSPRAPLDAEGRPEWLDGLDLDGVRAFGRSWHVAVDGDEVLIL